MAFLPAFSTLLRAWTIPGELSCGSIRTTSLWDSVASWFIRLCLLNVMHAISTHVAWPTSAFFGCLCFWHNMPLSVLLLVTHGKSADHSEVNPDCRCFEHLGSGTESSTEDPDMTSEIWLCDELKNERMSGCLEAIESVARVKTSTQRNPSLISTLEHVANDV